MDEDPADPRSVRVELDHGKSSDLDSSTHVQDVAKRWPVAMAVLGALAFMAVLLGLGRTDTTVEPPPTTDSSEPVVNLERIQTSEVVDRIPVDVDPHQISSISNVGDEWIAATRDVSELLWSGDGGVTWATIDAEDQPRNVLAVGRGSDGLARVMTTRSASDNTDSVETNVLRDGSWVVDRQRQPIVDIEGRILDAFLGDESIVLVEDSWDRPVQEVSDALAEFVSQDVADETCGVTRTFVETTPVYELSDCSGALLDTIGKDLIDLGSESDDRLAFAQEVLRTRNVVYVSQPGEDPSIVELGPSQLVLSLTPTNDGFLALILDSIEVLDNTSLLYSQALVARLVHWDRASNSVSRIETPVRAWAGNKIVGNDDSSVTLISALGLYRSQSPFTEWTLLTTGPTAQLAPGQAFGSALYGDGFFVDHELDEEVFWATCCNSESVENWQGIATGGSDFRRVLISTKSMLVFDTFDRKIVQVAR